MNIRQYYRTKGQVLEQSKILELCFTAEGYLQVNVRQIITEQKATYLNRVKTYICASQLKNTLQLNVGHIITEQKSRYLNRVKT